MIFIFFIFLFPLPYHYLVQAYMSVCACVCVRAPVCTIIWVIGSGRTTSLISKLPGSSATFSSLLSTHSRTTYSYLHKHRIICRSGIEAPRQHTARNTVMYTNTACKLDTEKWICVVWVICSDDSDICIYQYHKPSAYYICSVPSFHSSHFLQVVFWDT